MRLLDELRREHDRIDAALGALRTWAAAVGRRAAPLAHRERFVAFFRLYAGAFHHDREEKILFPAITGEARLPDDAGPLAVLLDDHRRMGALLQQLAVSSEPAELDHLAREYAQALWMHIDAENSVLFPESERALVRHGVFELPSRPPTLEEDEAAADADELIRLYPPAPCDALRGDGCVMCHAYGDTCRGVEWEWWNEWEWDELADRVAAG